MLNHHDSVTYNNISVDMNGNGHIILLISSVRCFLTPQRLQPICVFSIGIHVSNDEHGLSVKMHTFCHIIVANRSNY